MGSYHSKWGVLLIDVYKILIGDGINVLWFLLTLVLSEIIFDVLYQIITKYTLATSFLFSICGSFLYIFSAKNINSHAIVIFLQVIGRPLFVLPFFCIGCHVAQIFIDIHTCKALMNTKIPVLIIHGDKDTQAPVAMAYRLNNSCKSEKQMLIIRGAGHTDCYKIDPLRYENAVYEFIKNHIT